MNYRSGLKGEPGRQNQQAVFGAQHNFALHEYWSWRCAVCETADSPIVCTPWLDAIRLNGPGLVPTNMLPLCSVCILQKGSADPLAWLTEKLGPKKAAEKMAQIHACFRTMADHKALDFWCEMGLHRALQRVLESPDQPGTLRLELIPGQDDDLLLWLNALDSQQRQHTAKAALRAYLRDSEFDPLHYLESILTRAGSERRVRSGAAEGHDVTRPKA